MEATGSAALQKQSKTSFFSYGVALLIEHNQPTYPFKGKHKQAILICRKYGILYKQK